VTEHNDLNSFFSELEAHGGELVANVLTGRRVDDN